MAVVSQEDLSSLHRQLAEAHENLRIIQERKTGFVSHTDVPLQLIKDERRWLDTIAELEQQLAQPADLGRPSSRPDDVRGTSEQFPKGLTALIDIITGFVDRQHELIQFRRMLTGEAHERVLLVLEAAEQGKTYFLLRLAHECEQQTPSIPMILLDFDQRRSALTTTRSVAWEVRRYLGDDATPAVCACLETIQHSLENLPTADRAKEETDLGRALCSDLTRLGGAHRRVVLLMDTFEHASPETCRWLEDWLFEPLRNRLRHIILVVAGRPECQAFFARPRLWSGLVATIDRFTPLSDDDILAHYRQRRLPLSKADLPLLLELARSSPARMAQVGDWLAQTRRGAP